MHHIINIQQYVQCCVCAYIQQYVCIILPFNVVAYLLILEIQLSQGKLIYS